MRGLYPRRQTPHPSRCCASRPPSPTRGEGKKSSHRRGDAVAADIDAVGFQHAVVFLHGAEDDDLDAGFTSDLSPATKVTIGVSAAPRLSFSPSLYLTRMFWPSCLDRFRPPSRWSWSIRALVPGPEAFGGAALVLGEDMHRDRLLDAVGLRHRGDADVGALLDFRERGL